MKMNKKGFTLVELLAVIVIIALLSGIAAISYTAFVNSTRDRVYKTYEDTMKSAAEMYLIDNGVPEIGTTRIPLSNLEIDPINNPDDSSDLCPNSYVDVIRGSNVLNENNFDLTYNVCLKCNEYKSTVCE